MEQAEKTGSGGRCRIDVMQRILESGLAEIVQGRKRGEGVSCPELWGEASKAEEAAGLAC